MSDDEDEKGLDRFEMEEIDLDEIDEEAQKKKVIRNNLYLFWYHDVNIFRLRGFIHPTLQLPWPIIGHWPVRCRLLLLLPGC